MAKAAAEVAKMSEITDASSGFFDLSLDGETDPSANKSVRFSPQAAIYYTLRRKDYSRQEKLDSFFQRPDYESMMYDCIQVAERLIEGECVDTRGLEPLLQPDDIRKYSIQSVLALQEQQSLEQSKDVNALAAEYQRNTASCLGLAIQLGREDRKAIERYMKR